MRQADVLVATSNATRFSHGGQEKWDGDKGRLRFEVLYMCCVDGNQTSSRTKVYASLG